MLNIRDRAAGVWDRMNRVQRTIFAVIVIGLTALLPYAADFPLTSFLNTPITSYQATLVYPIAMFVLMALGLNIVVGKSEIGRAHV